MRHAMHALNALMIQDLHDLRSHLFPAIRFGVQGAVGLPVPEQVRREHAVAAGAEIGDLEAPVVAGGGEAMEEEERGERGVGGDVDVAVGGAGGELEGLGVLGEGDGCHFFLDVVCGLKRVGLLWYWGVWRCEVRSGVDEI